MWRNSLLGKKKINYKCIVNKLKQNNKLLIKLGYNVKLEREENIYKVGFSIIAILVIIISISISHKSN